MNKIGAISLLAATLTLIACQERPAPGEAGDVDAGGSATPAAAAADPRPDAAAPTPTPPAARDGYFVIGLSASERADADREAERRAQQGHRVFVADSSEWPAFSPGYYIVVYGVFGDQAEAEAEAGRLRESGIETYVKYSREGNPSAASDGTATPEGEASGAKEEPAAEEGARRESPAGQPADMTQEALREVERLWERHFMRCGDSYVSLGRANTLRQLKGVTFTVSRRFQVTAADRLKGVLWKGGVTASWDRSRSAVALGAGWEWGEWRTSPQKLHFDVTRNDSGWRVLNVIYDQKKVECPTFPD